MYVYVSLCIQKIELFAAELAPGQKEWFLLFLIDEIDGRTI